MTETKKLPLLVLVGPTAVGKTAVAIDLALRLNGEIVTADSMQVYRGMDVATAKPTAAEQRGVPHHLIDVADPGEVFNVARYRSLARATIDEIHRRKHLPILSGGTGLYVKAVLGDFLFPDTGSNPAIRSRLAAEAAEKGVERLHARLAEVDPAAAKRLHPNDLRRVTRALEVYERTGKTLSAHLANSPDPECPYRVAKAGLTRDREHLYARINQRVWAQIEAGLVAEATRLMEQGLFETENKVAAQALGYKEIYDYVLGRTTLEKAVERLQKSTRHYAKRQYTWFRRDPDITWFDLDEYPSEQEAAQTIATWAVAELSL